MQSPSETLLCRYHYDPIDRLIANTLPNEPERQRFYCKSRLATEIQGANHFSIVQHGDQLLGQQWIVNYSDPSGHNPLFKSILKSLFGTFSDPNSKSWLPRFGHRPHSFSQRRLSDPGPAIPSLTEPDFWGLHGTSRDSANKLLKEGVQPQRAETRPGFFLSPDKEIAVDYANRQQYRSTKEDSWSFGKDNIVEVHVQNLAGKTPGKDYEFNYYGFDHRRLEHMTMEFMAMPHISRSIVIRKLGTTAATKKVRPRAFEAPF